jgi:hypothetical protein
MILTFVANNLIIPLASNGVLVPVDQYTLLYQIILWDKRHVNRVLSWEQKGSSAAEVTVLLVLDRI